MAKIVYYGFEKQDSKKFVGYFTVNDGEEVEFYVTPGPRSSRDQDETAFTNTPTDQEGDIIFKVTGKDFEEASVDAFYEWKLAKGKKPEEIVYQKDIETAPAPVADTPQIAELKLLIKTQLEMCNVVDTPMVCQMHHKEYDKLQSLIISRIVEQSMSIGDAIISIEKELNPNIAD